MKLSSEAYPVELEQRVLNAKDKTLWNLKSLTVLKYFVLVLFTLLHFGFYGNLEKCILIKIKENKQWIMIIY